MRRKNSTSHDFSKIPDIIWLMVVKSIINPAHCFGPVEYSITMAGIYGKNKIMARPKMDAEPGAQLSSSVYSPPHKLKSSYKTPHLKGSYSLPVAPVLSISY